MKRIKTIILITAGVLAILEFSLFFKGCEHENSAIENKATKAIIIDSLKRIETARLKKYSDSLISIHEKRDSITKIKVAKLTQEYNVLRGIIKHLTSVRVDSSNQVVIVPVIEYNALVESGNKCDSMSALNNERIALKDSVNSQLAGQVKIQEEQNAVTQQALRDQRALTAEEKKKGDKAKKLNKFLIKIVVIETAIMAIVAFVI